MQWIEPSCCITTEPRCVAISVFRRNSRGPLTCLRGHQKVKPWKEVQCAVNVFLLRKCAAQKQEHNFFPPFRASVELSFLLDDAKPHKCMFSLLQGSHYYFMVILLCSQTLTAGVADLLSLVTARQPSIVFVLVLMVCKVCWSKYPVTYTFSVSVF